MRSLPHWTASSECCQIKRDCQDKSADAARGSRHLHIESRGLRQDEHDKATILDVLNNLGSSGSLNYDWHGKEEPFLWMADAIRGVVRAFLLGTEDAGYFDRLQKTGVINELVYISPSSRNA